ncbi:MAG: energy transducer TonB [Bdellovibrionales bacterium]|nr:energy transducer TonB [Bdellovibrionales bacterium]
MKKEALQFAIVWSVFFHASVIAIAIYLPVHSEFSVSPVNATEDAPLAIRLVAAPRPEAILDTLEAPKELEKEQPDVQRPERPETKQPLLEKPVPKKIAPAPQKVVSMENRREPQSREAERREESLSSVTAKLQSDTLIKERVARAVRSYESLIVGLIAKEKHYPERARRMGIEGTVGLSVRVSPDGELIESSVYQESKFSFFDREVLRMAKAAAPFPKAPPMLQGKSVTVRIPVQFTLR